MPRFLNRPQFAHKHPAPRRAPGPPRPITDDIEWTRDVQPRERYRIMYRGGDNELTERTVELQKVGSTKAGYDYFGVMQAGKFKTLRADRVIAVIEQLTTGHEPSIHPRPSYSSILPAFPIDGAVYKVPTIASGKRTWTVDLNHYTCTCPEKRIRHAAGYEPGQLGFVCLHMARAILDHLPAGAANWPRELLSFLGERRNVHIDNLT